MLQELELLAASVIGAQCRQLALDCILTGSSLSSFLSVSLFTARTGSRQMQALTAAQRATAVNTLADLLVSREKFILDANAKDLAEAQKSGLAKPLLSRLSLNSAKLKNLSIGLKQIADDSHKVSAKWKTNWVKKMEN